MLKVIQIKFEDIYVPAARRKELEQARVDEITERMMAGDDEQKPIRVREGKGRFVLTDGIHRLEASKALGEETIGAYIVQASKF